MMTRLMGVQDPAADRHAIALGVAMQLTNIARDVREDAQMCVLARTLITSIAEDLKLVLCSITQIIQDTQMNDTNFAEPSTVAQAKHAVYLGLSLTAIMAAALFVMVFINPKDVSYSYLPLVYSGASLFVAILFNRLAARCEISQQSSGG